MEVNDKRDMFCMKICTGMRPDIVNPLVREVYFHMHDSSTGDFLGYLRGHDDYDNTVRILFSACGKIDLGYCSFAEGKIDQLIFVNKLEPTPKLSERAWNSAIEVVIESFQIDHKSKCPKIDGHLITPAHLRMSEIALSLLALSNKELSGLIDELATLNREYLKRRDVAKSNVSDHALDLFQQTRRTSIAFPEYSVEFLSTYLAVLLGINYDVLNVS